MRINEYNSLDEFIDEYYKGVEMPWQSSDGKRRYMGIEFSNKGVYYRMCREPGEDNEMPKLPVLGSGENHQKVSVGNSQF